MTDQNTEYAILGGVAIMAVAALVSLASFHSGIDFIIDAAIAAATYWFGYRNYKAGNLAAAKLVFLVAAILCGLFALLGLLAGAMLAFVISAAATAAYGYAYMQLNNNPASQGTADFSKTPGTQAGLMMPNMSAATHTPSAPTPAPTATPHTAPAAADDDIATRLRELASLKEQGLITNAEYEKKRGEILKTV